MSCFTTNSKPICERHHHIEYRQIEACCAQRFKSGSTIIDRRDLVIFELEDPLHGLANRGVIFGNEYFAGVHKDTVAMKYKGLPYLGGILP